MSWRSSSRCTCSTRLIDWLLAAVLPQISEELNLSETQAGWLSTVLLLGLAAASPPVGYLADRMRRPRLLAMGFAVWSVATVATGLARSYDQLQLARALVGVGGAIFAVVALTILMDLFPRSVRARALAVFFLAVPLGAALGLSVGAAFARVTAWQTAFLAVGAPGLLLALVALVLPDPVRGSSEGVDIQRLRLHERVGPSREDYVDLMVNSSYTYSVFGITFSSFALAGLVYWSPTFLTVAKGLTDAQADSPLGLTFLGAAILGTAAGGWLADWSTKSNPRALFVVPGLAMLAAIPFVLAAIYGRSVPWISGRIVPGRRRDVHEHRAVLYDHRQCRDAQHAGGRLRRGPGVDPSSGGHLVAGLDGLGCRYIRPGRFHGHDLRQGTGGAGRGSGGRARP